MKKIIALLLTALILLTGCGSKNVVSDIPLNMVDDRYNTYYEIFVYSFCDSDGDRVGDLQGVISKLDYLNDGDDTTDEDLGIDAIWLMPIMPSSSYHKYDVEDYYNIDEKYGTLEDFDELIAECDARGIDVIIDLVINHSSGKHPWFLEAERYINECVKEGKEPDASECKYFDYYHFSKKLESGYTGLGNGWYYEAQFTANMPDLNLANPDVRAEIEDIVKFWFDRGVAGFRLDAVKEFYTGNNALNVETLEWFSDMVTAIKPDAYMVGECWTGAATYLQYYESGITSLFDYENAQAEGYMVKAAKNGYKAYTARDYSLRTVQIQQEILANNPEGINATFLSNHDNDRAAGYFSGENGVHELKMAAALNLLNWGNAFIYYGEEVGMKGSGTDPNRRAPMYWSADSREAGMTNGPSDMKGVTQKYDSVTDQLKDSNSILSFYRSLIRFRNQNPEIARGEITAYTDLGHDKVSVTKRTWEGSEVLVLINTSNEAEELDLSSITVNGKNISEAEVRGWLYADMDTKKYETGKIKGDTVKMPAFSIVILK